MEEEDYYDEEEQDEAPEKGDPNAVTFKPISQIEETIVSKQSLLSQSFNLTSKKDLESQIPSKQLDQFSEDNDLHYSDDSGFGRELADDSDFERDDLDFTTDDGSSIFSRALTSIESLGALMKVRK